MLTDPTPTVPRDLSPFSEWFGEVFRLWNARRTVWILQGLIFFLIAILPGVVIGLVSGVMSGIEAARSGNTTATGASPLLNLVTIICTWISFLLYPGMFNTAIKQLRGHEITVGDIFSGMRFFWGYFVVSLLSALGVIACIVGAFAVSGLLFMALPLMIDSKLPTMRAVSTSWAAAKQNFWLYVLFALVANLLATAGMIACYIGVIATISFLPIASAVAYERTFHPNALPPPTIDGPGDYLPPPPYSGLQ